MNHQRNLMFKNIPDNASSTTCQVFFRTQNSKTSGTRGIIMLRTAVIEILITKVRDINFCVLSGLLYLKNLQHALNTIMKTMDNGDDGEMNCLNFSFWRHQPKILWRKLAAPEVYSQMVGWIHGLQADRSFHVHISGVLSKEATVISEILQCSIISLHTLASYGERLSSQYLPLPSDETARGGWLKEVQHNRRLSL